MSQPRHHRWHAVVASESLLHHNLTDPVETRVLLAAICIMLYTNVIVFLVVLIQISALEGRRNEGRQGKFISFNTDDGDSMSVELDFTIPFIKIPIKKTMDAFGPTGLGFPTVNINLAALAIASVVVVGTVVVVPLLMKSGAALYPHQPYARVIEDAEFGADSVLNFANNLMMDKDSVQGCAMRIACWSATRPGDDAHNLLNQVTRNHIVFSMINATAVEEAIRHGRHGQQCQSYGPCTLTEEQMPILMNTIIALGK